MRKNKNVQELRKIAEKLDLKFIIEQPITSDEPVLAIVNRCTDVDRLKKLPDYKLNPCKAEPTLTAVSQKLFADKHGFVWTNGAVGRADEKEELTDVKSLNTKYIKYITQAHQCKKALLKTDHGYATINLEFIKKAEPVLIYEGEYFSTSPDDPYIEGGAYILSVASRVASRKAKLWSLAKADKYRGFGGFAQSLLTKEECKYYKFDKNDVNQVAIANLKQMSNFSLIVMFAVEDIPPLSLLGPTYNFEYFGNLNLPCVPFSKIDGFSLPYEVARCQIHFDDISRGVTGEWDFPVDVVKEIYNKVSKKGFYGWNLLILKDQEKTKIKEYLAKKQVTFNLVITTPNILLMKTVYEYSRYPYHAMINAEKSLTQEIKNSSANINEVVLPMLTEVEKIAEKDLLFAPSITAIIWRQYFSYQSIFLKATDVLFKILLESINNQSLTESALIKKYKITETVSSKQYPLILRKAAACNNPTDLWFLVATGKALKYIDDCGASTQKTALHFAVESKLSTGDKYATCLLLLRCKANPGLKDSIGRIPQDYIKKGNPALTFLFNQMRHGPDPDNLGKELNKAAALAGFR